MTAPQSFDPAVFRTEPPTLLAVRCPECGVTSFPRRELCPYCTAELVEVEATPLSPQGVVYSYTVVRQAPEGVATPYVLAYVDLPEEELRLLSRLVGFGDMTPDLIGSPVRLVTAPMDDPEDDRLRYAFEATAQGASA
ncbi:Zn-ribbon domain-containing OB-fold protein [Nonomuraea lactucae]|uniref:Zn-ribbon domain-containing OB-fold protein n=1 Tax=Nonomuraea lactucae TaxID=2249762 RepID=UPI0013B37624|nr:OB-fold domain-containing protein [Nonomuraea lactucae]